MLRRCRARLCYVKPNVPRQPGVKGATPPRRRRHFHEEPLYATDVPFVGPALRTHRSLCSPRGLMWGASGTVSAFGHSLLQTSLDGQASGGQRGVAPLHSPARGTPGPRFGGAGITPCLIWTTAYRSARGREPA